MSETRPIGQVKRYGISTILPVSAACVSDVGLVRENNEDNFFLGLEEGIFIVSDGMGGHQSGEIASRIVVELLPQLLENLNQKITTNSGKTYRNSLISDTVIELNHLVWEKAQESMGLRGMGATLALAWVTDVNGMVYMANVGDSRIYYYHNRQVHQLSQDHTVLAVLLAQGEVKLEEAADHPARGKLYRYIGMQGEPKTYLSRIHMRPGDELLLCSDGITDHLSDEDIQKVLLRRREPLESCSTLVNAANQQGGNDNITAMIIRWYKQAAKLT